MLGDSLNPGNNLVKYQAKDHIADKINNQFANHRDFICPQATIKQKRQGIENDDQQVGDEMRDDHDLVHYLAAQRLGKCDQTVDSPD